MLQWSETIATDLKKQNKKLQRMKLKNGLLYWLELHHWYHEDQDRVTANAFHNKIIYSKKR